MKIYTKTGDAGETGLFGGARVSKASARVEAYGEVDELNSTLGVARAIGLQADVDGLLAQVQLELFDVGAELAAVPEKAEKLFVPALQEESITRLERAIDTHEEVLPALQTFILPGGTLAAAQLHVARTVCRRAERRVVALAAQSPVRDELRHYLNRLSDLLFVLARVANHGAGVPDVPWKGRDRR
ncbi:MAG: cob(I)yrinic acid a,c-diamide adenosyltransferase [Myxococcota bacterium]